MPKPNRHTEGLRQALLEQVYAGAFSGPEELETIARRYGSP